MENIIISAWAHNCGMHVIADYLIEKLKQEDYKTKFTGKVYDELLKTFQNCYQQKELTWESIRESSLKTASIDAQVIWGFALRKMLFSVIQENAEYKKDLFNSFVAALNEAKKTNQGEVIETYPIIYTGNQAYFKRQTYVENALETNHLKYWNENGFDQYCEAAITVFRFGEEGPSNYLWLGQEELTLFCQYFGIKPIFISNAQAVIDETGTLYFHNPTQTHWERKANKKVGEQSIKESESSDFEQVILNMGIALFSADPKLIGDIYFSDLYSIPTLGIQWLKDIGVDKVGEYFVKNDMQGFIEQIKNNKIKLPQAHYAKALGFIAGNFEYEQLLLWINNSELNKKFNTPYDNILWAALKHDKASMFENLLLDFSEKYTGIMRMPALILATRQNKDEIAKKLLDHPDFNKTGLINNVLSHIKPAYYHILNQFDEHETPALYYAIQNINIPLIEILLEKGACPNYSVKNRLAYEWALDTQNPDLIYLFIDTVPEYQLSILFNNQGDNGFHILLKNKDLINLEKFKTIYLRDKYNVEREIVSSINKLGQNGLHISAAMGYLEGIKYCLDNNASLFSQDNKGNTALHLAAKNGHLEIVKFLVAKLQEYNSKYDFNNLNNYKQNALHVAIDKKRYKVAVYLKSISCLNVVHAIYVEIYEECFKSNPNFEGVIFKHKEVVNLKGNRGYTLLHYVSHFKETEKFAQTIIKRLVEHGAILDAVTVKGKTPLHVAAESNNVAAVRELLAQGAFVDAITYEGKTACHYAVENDNKEIFLELKNKGANLNLAIFSSQNNPHPLTVRNLAEAQNGEIAAYLNPYMEREKAQLKFHSMEGRVLHWAENKLGLTQHAPTKFFNEIRELESTTTYQYLGLIKIGVCVGGATMISPYAGAAELAKQSFLYASPTIKQKAGQFYYYIKPGIHNYNICYASSILDYFATGASYTYDGAFKIVNYCDLYNNIGRRVIGGVAGIGGVKLAQSLGAEKEKQAFTLFFAREAGYFIVDAYNVASPERRAQKALTQYNVDPTLNQSYEVWGSILGKNRAGKFIYALNFVSEYKTAFYQYVGEKERKYFESSIKGFVDFKDYALNFMDFEPITAPPKWFNRMVQFKLNQLSEMQERFLIYVEECIHTYTVPDSEYQHIMLHYAHLQKELIYKNFKQNAEINLRHAIESENEKDITYYEQQIKDYNQNISASQKSANFHYEQTNKGKITNQYNIAQRNNFQVWSEKKQSDDLKNIKAEDLIQKAYDALGENTSPSELYYYLYTTIKSQKIKLGNEGLFELKSFFEPSKTQEPNFQHDLKKNLSEFFEKKLSNHSEQSTVITSETPQITSDELENIEKAFKLVATPEELRVLELNNKEEVKIQRYNYFQKQREVQIHEAAIINAKYSTYLIAATEYDDAQLNYILAQENLNNIQFYIDKKITLLNENQKLTAAERKEWLEEYNDVINEAKANLTKKEEVFIHKKEALQQINESLSSKFNPLERYHFKHFSNNFKENIELANKLNHAEIKNELDEKYQQYELDNKQDIQLIIDEKSKGVKQIKDFTFNVDEMRKLVANALAESGLNSEAAGNVVKRLAKILPFPEWFFEENVPLSFGKHDRIRGPGAKLTEKNWANYICTKLKELDYQIISYNRELLEEEIVELNNKISESDANLTALNKKVSENQNYIKSLESEYSLKLAPEEQEAFHNRNSEKGFSSNLPNANNISPQTNNLVKTIESTIEEGFKKYPKRNELSEFFADETIRLIVEREGVTKTKKQMEIFRQLLIHEISTYELSGYQRNQERSERRTYDFIYAKVTGTEKKRHRHRWERIVKPIINEIVSEFTGGFRPYKDFSGGDDKRGQSGLQLTWHTDGRFTLSIQKDNIPIWNIYDSKKPTRTIPEFSQPAQESSPITTEISDTKAVKANPIDELAFESDDTLKNSSLTADNSYVQPHLAKQLDEMCATTDALGKSPEAPKATPIVNKAKQSHSSKNAQPALGNKPTQKPNMESAENRLPTALETKRPEPVLFSPSKKPSDNWWRMAYRSFNGENSAEIAAWKKSNTQATPKWLVKFTLDMKEVSHPMEQVPRIVVEALGESAKVLLKENYSLDDFFKGQTVEGLIAEEKLRQQSYFMMTEFVGEEMTRVLAKEKPESLKYAEKFISNFYHSSQEDKLKGLVKIGAAVCVYKFSKLNSARLVSSAISHISKTENNPAPLTLHESAKTFLPAHNQIKAFSVKSALDGALYPSTKLTNLVNYLNQRGVHVYGTNGPPCFVVWRDNRPSQIYLPNNPTVLQVKHELSHWLDYKTLGKEKYLSLNRYEKEKLVLERLQQNRLWDDLNKFEKEFSKNYVESLNENAIKNGVRNDRR